MEKNYAQSEKEKKINNKMNLEKQKILMKTEEKANVEEKKEDKAENKVEEKKIIEKKTQKKKIKEIAFVNGKSLRISTKNSIYICKMIKWKSPETAIDMLEKVMKKKLVVEMRGKEIPHRKGKGIAEGRYPVKSSQEIIKLLKQLIANAQVNGIENPVISIAKADGASRPFKREGRKAKRTHLYIEVRNKNKLFEKKK